MLVRFLSLVLVALVAASCGLRSELPARWGGTRDTVAVGLVTSGSAFTRGSARRAVVRALERQTGRRVVVLDGDTSAADPAASELASRLTQENPKLAGYDWHERRCDAHADVRTAIAHDVEAIYRVSLDYVERSRAATDAEIARPEARPRWLVATLGGLHLVAPRTVREESLSGSVSVSMFTPGGWRRAPVSRNASELEASLLASRIDVDAAVTDALTKLPALRSPQWDTVARRLVGVGCPFLALEVWDTRLKGVRAHGRVRTAALAAMTGSKSKRTPAELAAETAARVKAAVREGDAEWAASILQQYEADPARQPATVRELRELVAAGRRRAAEARAEREPEADPGEETQSCNALCTMHMVELCNSNKVLWSANHAQWEAVPCGTRRDEPFLTECYRQQWLAGTFDTACLRPCESTPEGRGRLIRLLRSSGCLRVKPS